MTQLRKRALFSLIIWGVVITVFVPLFFAGGGPSEWLQDRVRKILMIVVFGIGYLSFFLMMVLTRRKRSDGKVVKDERDNLVEIKSSKIAYIIVLLYIYIVCIILYMIYERTGVLPVSWMWFIGYTSIFIGSIIYAVVSLIVDMRVSGYDER